MAKAWFESEFGKSKIISPPTSQTTSFTGDSTVIDYYFDQTFQITPTWTQSEISTYVSLYPIVVVPVRPIAFLDGMNQSYMLVVFRDSSNHISAKLQVYSPYAHYTAAHPEYSVNNFSGIFYQICLNGKVDRVLGVENGQFAYKINLSANENIGRIRASSRGICSRANNNNPVGLDVFVNAICNLFKGSGGDGGGPQGNTGESSSNYSGSLGYGSNITYSGSGGGGGSTGLSGQIDNTLFTETQLRSGLPRIGFNASEIAIILENTNLKKNVNSYLKKRCPRFDDNSIAVAIKNNLLYADNDPDLLNKYLDMLTLNDNYYNDNYAQNFSKSSVLILGKYLSEFSKTDFSNLYNDKAVFNQINAFLISYSFNRESIKVAKIQYFINREDPNYLNDSKLSQNFPPLIAAWILKAGAETVVDVAIDVAFGYLTGCAPGVYDHLLSFGTNIIGAGEIAEALKVEKYLAKVLEIANKIRQIPGGAKLADNIIIAGDKFLATVRNLDLTNLKTAETKLRGAFDNLLGSVYEARIAASVGNTIKGVAVRGTDLAKALGISTTQLDNIAARLGTIANDIEMDVLEEVNGKINLGECKLLEVVKDFSNFDKKEQLLKHAAFAKELNIATGKDVYMTLYVRNMSDAVKQSFVDRLQQAGVYLNIVIRQ